MTSYFQSDSDAHQLHPFMQYKEQGVAHAAQGRCCPACQIYAINASSSKVLPRLRTRGVAPHGDICEYTHLLGIYTCKLTAPFLLLHSLGGHPYRPAYLPNFDKRSLTLFKCMSIGAHCIPHCNILVEKERPATLNHPSPHIFFEPVDTTFV